MDYDQCLPEYKYLFQPNLLQGKVAFITGRGSGIGFTITEILMRHGCNAVIASRSKERVDAAAAKLVKATGQRCLALQMDVRKPQDIINAFDETLKTYSRLDILVNNAAGNFLSPVSGLSFNAFKTVMEIDAFGTFNCSKVAYEKYLRDHGGVIVNISANIHKKGVVLQAHVGAAKAAIDALTKHLAVEWGANKIRVVGLAPGPIDNTEGMRRLTGINKMNQDNEQLQKIPLGRRGTKVDMAHCVLFLVSDAGSYVMGETLVADGGSWLASSNSWHDAIQRMETVQAATQNQRRPSRL